MLLAIVLAALFGLARYRAGRVWQRILARNGVNLVQESNGVTWSQSKGGRTVFTLHAAKSVPHGGGHYTLQDAVLILYGKNGRNDRVSGKQFEYDETEGVLRALGEVHMDLQAPDAPGSHHGGAAPPELSFAPEDGTAMDPALIHVRTSGLVYTRKLGVAATDQPTEFRFQGITCTSRGAEFDSGRNTLRLLADVHLTGALRAAPFTLLATRAVLDRTANTTDLLEPRMSSDGGNARAAHAVFHLRQDGSVQTGDADGDVQIAKATRTVRAPRMHGEFGAQNRPERVQLFEGVTFQDTAPDRPAEGSAKNVLLTMTETGALHTAVATGTVTLVTKDVSAAGVTTRRMRGQKVTTEFVADTRTAKRSHIERMDAVGGAEVTVASPGKVPGGREVGSRLAADELLTTFEPDAQHRAEPRRTVGTGHTQLEQQAEDGQRQSSTGDALDVRFAERLQATARGAGEAVEVAEVSTAMQTGHVELRSWPAVKAQAGSSQHGEARLGAGEPLVGRAAQAVFEAAAGTLTLTGERGMPAEVTQGQTEIRAPSIALHQGTGDGEATGGVEATTAGNEGNRPATHVLATRAELLHGADQTRFFGTEQHPAQLWQAGSQVRAARIVLDGARHTLSARPEAAGGSVRAVFASAAAGAGPEAGRIGRPAGVRSAGRGGTGSAEPGAGGKAQGISSLGATLPEASRDFTEVRASAMDYNDAQREAVFTGGVEMQGSAGVVTADHGAAFLAQDGAAAASGKGLPKAGPVPGAVGGEAAVNVGGRLDRLVMLGNVRVTQPGRMGTGEQLTYAAPTNRFVLTGTPAVPPRVHDTQQGTVTGATLLFGTADSSIVVAGTPAAGKQGKPTRVHTETDTQQ